MKDWEKFEDNATSLLREMFKNITIVKTGESDCTTGDIEFSHNDNLLFVEAKYCPSQSGQIVVLPQEDDCFIYSPESKNISNNCTDQIINELNNNFDKYKNVKQSAIHINIPENIIFEWIQKTYKSKNSEWIIASNKFENLGIEDMVFIPISEMCNYFNAKAVLRRKKSGTCSVPFSRRVEVNILTDSLFGQSTIYNEKEKRSYVELDDRPKDVNISEEFCLSKDPVNGNLYEVRKTSTTNNINILFELTLKKQRLFKDVEFEKYLQETFSGTPMKRAVNPLEILF